MPNAADIGRAELRLGDLATFLGVLRFGSIHGAARALAVTPSQVSKAIARLERHLGVRLLVRSSRGIVVSDAGRELAPRFEDLLGRADGLRGLDRRHELELTMAASAFMNTLSWLHIACDSSKSECNGVINRARSSYRKIKRSEGLTV